MKALYRILSIIIILSFAVGSLVACGKNTDGAEEATETDQTVEVTETQKETNEYGELSFTGVVPINTLDFEGEEITVLVRQYFHNAREWYKNLRQREKKTVSGS